MSSRYCICRVGYGYEVSDKRTGDRVSYHRSYSGAVKGLKEAQAKIRAAIDAGSEDVTIRSYGPYRQPWWGTDAAIDAAPTQDRRMGDVSVKTRSDRSDDQIGPADARPLARKPPQAESWNIESGLSRSLNIESEGNNDAGMDAGRCDAAAHRRAGRDADEVN